MEVNFRGKKKEIDLKIEGDHPGLDVNQFTQIAMIAQGRFWKTLHAESKRTKADFSKIFHTDFLEDSGHTERTGKRAVHSSWEKQHGLRAGNGTGARLHRMMKETMSGNSCWVFSRPQREVTGLCGNNLSVRGKQRRRIRREKNAQEEKCADAIQMELKNRQDTNHLFELLKKDREIRLEILKGQETKAEEMRKQIHAAIRVQRRRLSRRTIAENKGECANLKKESRELEEKLKQQAKILESAGALYQEREALSKKKSRRSRDRSSGSRKYFQNWNRFTVWRNSIKSQNRICRTVWKMSGNLTEIWAVISEILWRTGGHSCERAAGGRTLSGGVQFLQSSEKSGIIRRRTPKRAGGACKSNAGSGRKRAYRSFGTVSGSEGKTGSQNSPWLSDFWKRRKNRNGFWWKEAENALRKNTQKI